MASRIIVARFSSPSRPCPASELSEDLRRFLDQRPVQVRRLGAFGRLALWRRRNPTLAGVIAAGIVLVVTVSSIGLLKVLEERDRFRHERDTAQANLYRALIGEARSLIGARETGWYRSAIDNLAEAARMPVRDRDPMELRDLAILAMGNEHPSIDPLREWRPNEASVTDVAFSASGELAASATSDGGVRVWAIPSCDLLATLNGPEKRVTGVVFHPDGRWLFASTWKGNVFIWDLRSLHGDGAAGPGMKTNLEPVRRFALGGGTIYECALTPDGRRLAAACADGSVRVLCLRHVDDDPPGREDLKVLLGHKSHVYCVAMSHKGDRIASGGRDGTVRTWDIESGQELQRLNVINIARTLEFDLADRALLWSEPLSYGIGYMRLDLVTEGTSNRECELPVPKRRPTVPIRWPPFGQSTRWPRRTVQRFSCSRTFIVSYNRRRSCRPWLSLLRSVSTPLSSNAPSSRSGRR